jgi:hypothetical protein
MSSPSRPKPPMSRLAKTPAQRKTSQTRSSAQARRTSSVRSDLSLVFQTELSSSWTILLFVIVGLQGQEKSFQRPPSLLYITLHHNKHIILRQHRRRSIIIPAYFTEHVHSADLSVSQHISRIWHSHTTWRMSAVCFLGSDRLGGRFSVCTLSISRR